MLKKVVAVFLAVGVLSCAGVGCLASRGNPISGASVPSGVFHDSAVSDKAPTDLPEKKKLSGGQKFLIIGGVVIVVAGAGVGIAAAIGAFKKNGPNNGGNNSDKPRNSESNPCAYKNCKDKPGASVVPHSGGTINCPIFGECTSTQCSDLKPRSTSSGKCISPAGSCHAQKSSNSCAYDNCVGLIEWKEHGSSREDGFRIFCPIDNKCTQAQCNNMEFGSVTPKIFDGFNWVDQPGGPWCYASSFSC